MASKKKPKPRFEVPDELGAAPKAGWVYRSAAAKPAGILPPPAAGAARPRSEPYRLADAGAETVGYSLGAVGSLFMVGTRVIALPMRLAIQFLRGR